MVHEVIASIDIGSSGVRASAYTSQGELIGIGKSKYKTYYEYPGWAEQDPYEWKASAKLALKSMAQELDSPFCIKGIALTGQCPTYLPLDKDMEPLGRAYTYQDNRAIEQAQNLEMMFGSRHLHNISGHSIFPFYVLPKLLWQREKRKDIFEKIRYVVQPRDYIALYLTGELATEETHANATLVYDLKGHCWNNELIEKLDLDPDIFPQRVLHPWQQVGSILPTAAEETGLEPGIPVFMGAADSQCCCFGVGALEPDILSEMSGTSTCLNSTILSPIEDLRVGNYAHLIPDTWCSEIGLNSTGASFEWLANVLFPGQSDSYDLIRYRLTEVEPGSDGLIFLPYLAGGERDNPALKGGFYNLNLRHGIGHLGRAVLEGVAFAIRERVEILNEAACFFSCMRISGGGAILDEWCQIKADVLGIPVYAIKEVDAAELGAAMLAGIGAGVFKNCREAIQCCVPEGRPFWPRCDVHNHYIEAYKEFQSLEYKI